jgi:hypothetical protein
LACPGWSGAHGLANEVDEGDVDYRNRAEPSLVLAQLRELSLHV